MELNSLQVLARLALLLALAVIALGAYTRLVHAGLGCPDWPGCYGHLIMPFSSEDIAQANQNYPDNTFKAHLAIPEVAHRILAGSLGLLILAFAFSISWCKRKRPDLAYFLPVKLVWFCVLVVIVQALFGMWTVSLKLWPQVVTLHLLGGFSVLSLLFLAELKLRRHDRLNPVITLTSWESQSGLKALGWITLLVLIGQIALGGWLSSNYAALACLDFPTCQQSWWPKMDFAQGFDINQQIGPNYLGGQMDNEARTAIHYTHRINALVLTLLALLLLLRCRARGISHINRAASKFIWLLLLQLALGISNVVLHLPLIVAVAHNLVGALLLLSCINLLRYLHDLKSADLSELA